MHDRYTIFIILQPLGRSCNRIQILIDSDQSTFVRKPLADLLGMSTPTEGTIHIDSIRLYP